MNSVEEPASVLAVDDDARSLTALQGLLSSMPLQVVTARSGEEALRCVLRQEFAAILMDARMPGMDGFEAARLIRERARSRYTPIIFLTGAYEDTPSMTRGYEVGAVDYIVKPLRPEILRSKISVFVDLYRKNAALLAEIRERTVAEKHLKASQDNLRALAAHLHSVREEESARIAREFHDQLGQALTGLNMDLKWIAARLPNASQAVRERMQAMSGLIETTTESVRQIVARLRSDVLEHHGLTAAIAWQAEEFQRRSGIRCIVSPPEADVPLDAARSIVMFRIFQELLTNVARHANATRVQVAVRSGRADVALTVEDNGRGIDAEAVDSPKSLGFIGVRERLLPFGGRLQVEGVRGKGTVVTVILPVA
ncbi:MAG TPA: response regulator [Steroidobacteraceae bacterium]|jgi:signal transduction histidine kinase|nr:response regulator [Steroidobacteraceae bacterium]